MRIFGFEFGKSKYHTEEVEITQSKQPKNDVEKAGKGTISEASTFSLDNLVSREVNRNLTTYDMWTAYLVNSWVRACVDKIIKEVVKYDPIIVPKDGVELDEGVKARITSITDLLSNPNEKIESFDAIRRKYLRDILIYDAGAIEIVYGNLKEEGKTKLTALQKEIFKLKKSCTLSSDVMKKILEKEIIIKQREVSEVRASFGIPVELYDIKGTEIKFNVDAHGNFKKGEAAYKLYSKGKVSAEFALNELIYFIANPQSGSLYGLSPIETLVNEIKSDNAAASFNAKILAHSGLVSGVLTFPGMSREKIKKFQLYLKEEIKRKGQKLIITNNPNVAFIKLSSSQKDMQFLEYQKWLLNKIMAVYGMQPIVLGIVDATTGKLNSGEQREQFYQDAILPLLKLEAHHFTDILIKQGFKYDDLKFTHASPIDIDDEFNLKVFVEACKVGGVIKVNEARELIGLIPLDIGGDEFVSGAVQQAVREVSEVESEKSELSGLKQRIRDILEPKPQIEKPEVTDTEKKE